MRIVTRVVLQPRDDGETVEIFDREEGDLDPYRVRDYYVASFGEPHDFAYTDVDDISEPVAIGWAFEVPHVLQVPGSHEDFEMLLIPMIPDPIEAGPAAESLQSLFVYQARERRDFEDLARDADIPLQIVEAGQEIDDDGHDEDREPPAPPHTPRVFRLPGYGGAALMLRAGVLPVADERRATLSLDIILIDPGVRTELRGRCPEPGFAGRAGRFLFAAAEAPHPEVTVPAMSDPGLGLTLDVVASTDLAIELVASVVIDPDAEPVETQGLNFRTSRAAVAAAAHQVGDIVGHDEPVGVWGP